jgi:LuxR family maltose regulon positive regulatory protein
VFDDVHLLDARSAAAELLAEVIERLPGNGHVVLAARAQPAVALSRRRVAGEVTDLGELELRFTDDEARAFAAMRVATPGSIAAAAGWPALAELLATADRSVAVDYLWDEVLSTFDEDRRRALATLHAIGGADTELLSTVYGHAVDVWALTRGVPMVVITDDGWAQVHDLWEPALTRVLSVDERRTARRGAATAARARGDLPRAVTLFASVGAMVEVRELVRRVCADSHPLVPGEVLTNWHRILVAHGLDETAEAALLAGAVRKPADPLGSIAFFDVAARRFAAMGDIDGEISAIFHLGHIAWWHEDYELLARLFERGEELAAAGSPLAASIVTLGPLVLGEVLGDADGVIAAARASEREHQHAEIVPLMDFLEARAHLVNGDPLAALQPATRACDAATPTMRPPADFERLSCLWVLGRRDEVLARVGAAIADLEEVGWIHNRAANGAQAALWMCLAGQMGAARAMLDRAVVVRDSAGSWARALVSLAEAMVCISNGDETGATDVLAAEVEVRPLLDPAVVRAHRAWIPLTYVLLPECRVVWDVMPLRGTIAAGRAMSQSIVALRERAVIEPGGFDAFEPSVARAQIPVPWLADLAVILTVRGRVQDAADLLVGLADVRLRVRLRELSKSANKSVRAAASSLLASQHVPPERSVRIEVLGPLRVAFDGLASWPVQFNRRAVRELLLLLVERGVVTRARACSMLWPDLVDEAGRNNLRVTLTYLTQALQPDRQANEPSHFIEDLGDSLSLRSGASLRLDVDEFHEALRLAAEYEQRGAASAAMAAYHRAAALYRGEHLASVDDVEWALAPRERERLAFVRAAVRGGELAVAQGDLEVATALALRSVEVDPWSEPARRLLAEARLASGDRSGAIRALDDCARVLADLGIGPEPETRMLARRVGFPAW